MRLPYAESAFMLTLEHCAHGDGESFGALGGTLRVFGAVGTVSGMNTYQWARLWFAHREPVLPDHRADAREREKPARTTLS